ncbi:MAG TPA: helix-turn-helix domain-containing protein [Streptosporangiaceae bacterium]
MVVPPAPGGTAAPTWKAQTMPPKELQALIDELAQRTGAPIVLEDHDHRLVAYSSQHGLIDDVRRDSILRRVTRPEIRDWFGQHGIHAATAPLRTPSQPRLGILGRLCAPVRFRGRLMGFLFLIDEHERLGPGDIEAVQIAQRQAALLLYEEELAERLNASVLTHLLAPAAEVREAAARQLVEQGLTADGVPHAVVCLQPAGPAVPRLPELLGETMWELGRHRGNGAVLRSARDDHCVLLVRVASLADDCAASELAGQARAILAGRLKPGHQAAATDGGVRVIAGIGDPQQHLTDVAVSYRRAVLAARVAATVPSVGDLARWRDLGVFRALVQLPADEDGASCLDPRLVTLLGAQDDLIQTVETYLDLGGDAKGTAEQLHLHRTTLYYRLHKAEQLTGADLGDGNDRLALHLGFKLARLLGRYPAPLPGLGRA